MLSRFEVQLGVDYYQLYGCLYTFQAAGDIGDQWITNKVDQTSEEQIRAQFFLAGKLSAMYLSGKMYSKVLEYNWWWCGTRFYLFHAASTDAPTLTQISEIVSLQRCFQALTQLALL